MSGDETSLLPYLSSLREYDHDAQPTPWVFLWLYRRKVTAPGTPVIVRGVLYVSLT